MKNNTIKQPWPWSTKITLWVLSILLAAIALFFLYIILPAPAESFIVY